MSDLLMMSMLRDMQTEIKSMSRQIADIQKEVKLINKRLNAVVENGLDVDSPCRICPFLKNGNCNGHDPSCFERVVHLNKKTANEMAEEMLKQDFDL